MQDNSTEIIACPIHPSLVRPILLGGGDRALVILNFTCIILLIFGVGIHVATVILALLLGTIGQGLLIRLARFDPDFSRVYLRHIRYRDFYSAQSLMSNQERKLPR